MSTNVKSSNSEKVAYVSGTTKKLKKTTQFHKYFLKARYTQGSMSHTV